MTAQSCHSVAKSEWEILLKNLYLESSLPSRVQEKVTGKLTYHSPSKRAVPVANQSVGHHEADGVRVCPANSFHGYGQVCQRHLVILHADLVSKEQPVSQDCHDGRAAPQQDCQCRKLEGTVAQHDWCVTGLCFSLEEFHELRKTYSDQKISK